MRLQSPPHSRTVQGFTLLELLVVVVIIGLLASYVGPRYFGQIGKTEQQVARTQIEGFNKALDAFRVDTGRYLTTQEGLQALMIAPADVVSSWAGPYLKKSPPPDPWGHPYRYENPGASGEAEVSSWGKDAQPGGTGENADL